MNAVVDSLIRKTPGVLGGEARVGDKRVAVWMLVQARRLGVTDAELLDRYVVELTNEDLTAAWAYYAWHRDEIEDAIRRNEED